VPTGKAGIETAPLTLRLRVVRGTVSAKDSVIRVEDVECIDLSRDKDEWRALVQAVTNCRAPYTAGYGTPDFSRTMTHGVSALVQLLVS
jgi:hypothetical protein